MTNGGAPVKATVKTSNNGKIKKIEVITLGKSSKPIVVPCENGQQIGVTGVSEDVQVAEDGFFQAGNFPSQGSYIEGKFTRSGVMKGTFSYSAEVTFGDDPPTTCETESPEPFKATPSRHGRTEGP